MQYFLRNAERETSRQKKFVEYKETGQWPGKKKRQVKTEAWAKSKELKAIKEDPKSRRKQEMRERKKRKRIELSQDDMQELEKDIALLKKFKKKKVHNIIFYNSRQLNCANFAFIDFQSRL